MNESFPNDPVQKGRKRQSKRGKDLGKLMEVIDLLVSGELFPVKFRDHALTGNWNGWRDCHIEPDWLLIYKPLAEELILARTGNHADLF